MLRHAQGQYLTLNEPACRSVLLPCVLRRSSINAQDVGWINNSPARFTVCAEVDRI